MATTKQGTFGVRFLVGDETYAVSLLDPHPDVAHRAFRFRKLTGDHAVYDVRLTEFGLECDCRGFLAHNHCKHLDTLVAASRVFRLA